MVLLETLSMEVYLSRMDTGMVLGVFTLLHHDNEHWM
jgi:hypothetical protein